MAAHKLRPEDIRLSVTRCNSWQQTGGTDAPCDVMSMPNYKPRHSRIDGRSYGNG